MDLSNLARLLSSPARATMLSALLDGRALSAGELARSAGVAGSTASEHLAALSDGGLVVSLRSGRHRYYRLGGAEVASTLEAWFRLEPPAKPRSLRASAEARRLAFARTCYDHLAGQLGVAVHAAMLEQSWLHPTTDGYDVAPAGEHGLARMSVDLDAARASRRGLARPCLDWTERRYHLAGAVAGQLCSSMLAQGWLRRGAARGIEVTPLGAEGLTDVLGLTLSGQRQAPAAVGYPAVAWTFRPEGRARDQQERRVRPRGSTGDR